jgi:hypothetical protein
MGSQQKKEMKAELVFEAKQIGRQKRNAR